MSEPTVKDFLLAATESVDTVVCILLGTTEELRRHYGDLITISRAGHYVLELNCLLDYKQTTLTFTDEAVNFQLPWQTVVIGNDRAVLARKHVLRYEHPDFYSQLYTVLDAYFGSELPFAAECPYSDYRRLLYYIEVSNLRCVNCGQPTHWVTVETLTAVCSEECLLTQVRPAQ